MIVHTLIFSFGDGRTQLSRTSLVSFERGEQQRSPYGAVWANTEPFTPVAAA